MVGKGKNSYNPKKSFDSSVSGGLISSMDKIHSLVRGPFEKGLKRGISFEIRVACPKMVGEGQKSYPETLDSTAVFLVA